MPSRPVRTQTPAQEHDKTHTTEHVKLKTRQQNKRTQNKLNVTHKTYNTIKHHRSNILGPRGLGENDKKRVSLKNQQS